MKPEAAVILATLQSLSDVRETILVFVHSWILLFLLAFRDLKLIYNLMAWQLLHASVRQQHGLVDFIAQLTFHLYLESVNEIFDVYADYSYLVPLLSILLYDAILFHLQTHC
jgi:hypothetical protein